MRAQATCCSEAIALPQAVVRGGMASMATILPLHQCCWPTPGQQSGESALSLLLPLAHAEARGSVGCVELLGSHWHISSHLSTATLQSCVKQPDLLLPQAKLTGWLLVLTRQCRACMYSYASIVLECHRHWAAPSPDCRPAASSAGRGQYTVSVADRLGSLMSKVGSRLICATQRLLLCLCLEFIGTAAGCSLSLTLS